MMKIYLLWFSVLCTVQNMTQIFQYHCCNQAKTYIFNMIKKCQQQKYHKQQSEDYMTSTSIRLHFASYSICTHYDISPKLIFLSTFNNRKIVCSYFCSKFFAKWTFSILLFIHLSHSSLQISTL